jgi:putative Mn2+ efflux pump MntP
MNVASTALIALAMSTDAFAAAVAKGASLHRPRFVEALRTGAIFGAIEATTPVIGWALGRVAAKYVVAFDHWIAFALLAGLGVRMIHAGLTDDAPVEEKPARHSFWILAMTGLGTSIDAAAVGVGLAFVDVDIFPVALAIGMTTLVMVTLGVMLGRVLGAVVGKRAEIAGGVILILIGAFILYEHLSAAAL